MAAGAAVIPKHGASARRSFWGAPTAKVGTGALAGALTTLLVAMLKGHVNWITDSAVITAITSLLTFVVQYLIPERDGNPGGGS